MKSESIRELAAALAKAQGQFDHAKKDVKNEFFKSKYADLASVIDAAKKPLSDNGLSVCQVCETTESGDIRLETILMHSSGEWISGTYPIRPVKSDPQAYGSAITYARRYAFSAITGIAADDDDGNGATGNVPRKPVPTIDNIDYGKLLDDSLNSDELRKAFNSIPANLQDQYRDKANELRAKFTPDQYAEHKKLLNSCKTEDELLDAMAIYSVPVQKKIRDVFDKKRAELQAKA